MNVWSFVIAVASFVVGLVTGIRSEARRWRGNADHPYLRIESAGKLYKVKPDD